MPSIAQLKESVDDLEALTSVHAGNDNEAGLWLRFALAAEEAAGASTSANASITGYMLRTALALESIAGTTGAEENVNYQGLLKRIVDALEVQAGVVTTGSLEGRLVVAVAALEGDGTWTPAALATAPAVWLEADSGVTHVAGAVSAWLDKSANAYSFAQGTEANKPTYSATGFNGLFPAVTADGSNDFLRTSVAFVPVANNFTIFAVIDNWTTGQLFRDAADGNALLYYTGANELTLYDGGAITFTYASGQPSIITVDSAGSGSARVNGSTPTPTYSAASLGQTIGLAGQALDFLSGAGGGSPTNASVALFMILPSSTLADRQRLEGWAAKKYGLRSLLPAGHPYKAWAP